MLTQTRFLHSGMMQRFHNTKPPLAIWLTFSYPLLCRLISYSVRKTATLGLDMVSFAQEVPRMTVGVATSRSLFNYTGFCNELPRPCGVSPYFKQIAAAIKNNAAAIKILLSDCGTTIHPTRPNTDKHRAK